MIEVKLVSLRDLLQVDHFSKEKVKCALKSFECGRDDDVKSFLSRWAINNENNGSSRTYLALNGDLLQDGKLDIVAFFSLAITVTDYSCVETDDRKAIMGNVPGVKRNQYFPGYLLAQLARNDAYSHDDFDGVNLLAQAEALIYGASKVVGGNVVYLDCKESLKGYYERFGYRCLYFDPEKSMYKMMKFFW